MFPISATFYLFLSWREPFNITRTVRSIPAGIPHIPRAGFPTSRPGAGLCGSNSLPSVSSTVGVGLSDLQIESRRDVVARPITRLVVVVVVVGGGGGCCCCGEIFLYTDVVVSSSRTDGQGVNSRARRATSAHSYVPAGCSHIKFRRRLSGRPAGRPVGGHRGTTRSNGRPNARSTIFTLDERCRQQASPS